MKDIKEDAFKLELETAKKEIQILKTTYESQISELKEEVSFLKEKLTSQQEMLNMAVNYSHKLSKELANLKKRVDSGNFQSIH
ncbi:hypothetical protein JKA74_04335 [Marivirga sp. S37H4]|uniref:Uncharacterized protein n=1 Tax=Marivirga aurantiaca TaxID=2802615 RepID=A0A934WWA6_9BACT|nr:hypothetical protein [Marivirga aurantiaca]MBK6264254.1 hypothetical protein [Marivirga aurantiaca]